MTAKLGRQVALKVLSPDAGRDPERRHRFEKEAKDPFDLIS